MVNLQEITAFLNDFAPHVLAEDYDNVGLLVGDSTKEIHKVLVTLDADEAVAMEAMKTCADLILSHHPLIFKPLRRVTYDDSVARTTIALIKHDIALFSMHTNFDSVKSGLGDLFLDKIGKTKNRVPLDGDGENGIGRIATFLESTTLAQLLGRIKETFSLPNVRFVGDEAKIVNTVAVCNGGGADLVYLAKQLGADCYISGDLKYQHARFAYENGIALIEVPHYSAEKIFCEYAANLLRKKFENKLEVIEAKTNINVWKQFE